MHNHPIKAAPLTPRLPAFYFGADYNPEQWTPAFGYSVVAFKHDLMRGLKAGQSWLLMEQTPSQVQWAPRACE